MTISKLSRRLELQAQIATLQAELWSLVAGDSVGGFTVNLRNGTAVPYPFAKDANTYKWAGPGPEPASWYAIDGTKVYRSREDAIDD